MAGALCLPVRITTFKVAKYVTFVCSLVYSLTALAVTTEIDFTQSGWDEAYVIVRLGRGGVTNEIVDSSVMKPEKLSKVIAGGNFLLYQIKPNLKTQENGVISAVSPMTFTSKAALDRETKMRILTDCMASGETTVCLTPVKELSRYILAEAGKIRRLTLADDAFVMTLTTGNLAYYHGYGDYKTPKVNLNLIKVPAQAQQEIVYQDLAGVYLGDRMNPVDIGLNGKSFGSKIWSVNGTRGEMNARVSFLRSIMTMPGKLYFRDTFTRRLAHSITVPLLPLKSKLVPPVLGLDQIKTMTLDSVTLEEN